MKKHWENKPLKRSLKGNSIGLNMLGIGNIQSSPSEALYSPVHSSTDSPGLMVQGRVFQHIFAPNTLHSNAQRKDDVLSLQREESLKKNKRSLLEPSVVLSSDEEDTSVGSGSPYSGTSHFSSIPSGDSEVTVHDNYFTSNYFAITKSSLPRRERMKDPLGKLASTKPAIKRRKVKKPHPASPSEMASANVSGEVDVVCRCVRVGTMLRTPPKHVTFSTEYIWIDEQVQLQSSSLASCAWCDDRTMPALFLKTSQGEGTRLRFLLKMSRINGDSWYDSKSQHLGENYIILVFEKTLSHLEKVELQNIFGEISRRNHVDVANFTIQMSFAEANRILMESSKTCPAKTTCGLEGPSTLSHNRQTERQFSEFSDGGSTQTPSPKCLIPKQIAFTPPRCSPALALGSSPGLTVLSLSPTRPSSPSRCLSPVPMKVWEEEDDDDEIVEIESAFKGAVRKLILYPPPPARGGISVTNEDLHCLNDGEFLNDVIIDFYLKYLMLAVLKEEDSSRTHMFSSFFYKCLSQTEQGVAQGSEDHPVKKMRHNRVRTWTRNVDLFQKDFIFVPINESAHWFLAVICFPGLVDPQWSQVELQREPLYPKALSPPWMEEGEGYLDRGFLMDHNSNPMSLFFSPPGNSATGRPGPEPADLDLTIGVRLSVCSGGGGGEDRWSEFGMMTTSVGVHGLGLKQRQRLPGHCIRSEIEKDIFEFSPDQDSNPQWNAKPPDHLDVPPEPTNCKRPCILIMDSLGGNGRPGVVKILQEYLEVEWEVRKGTLRSVSKDTMRGFNPQVPQQDNFSDCGIYLLQYVESFFQNPPQDFEPHMNLKEWFPLQRVKRKRAEIRKLILKIQRQQEKDTKDLYQLK
ncbi:sentrin-specific protease 6 isoform X1 [Esox lucius]|uniref:sentrin-specific protease 6 isoform X1 n=1 Tax=Esox lucius TaxID=8010 RepID=UPI0014777283|nr:sentrin-specific protease 6 isoform X1 [Esox lucius]